MNECGREHWEEKVEGKKKAQNNTEGEICISHSLSQWDILRKRCLVQQGTSEERIRRKCVCENLRTAISIQKKHKGRKEKSK